MRRQKMQPTQMLIVAILLLLAVSLVGGGLKFAIDDLGYSSGFQGPKARFYGAEYGSKRFTEAPNRFDTVLSFDADDANGGKPDVKGEMTTVFVPESSLSYVGWKNFPEWAGWLQDNARLTNPKETYAWNISGKVYKMELWTLKFYVALSSEWQDREDLYPEIISEWKLGYIDRNYYSGLSIWLEFDIRPTWYIQGQGTAYFAIASINLGQDVKYQGREFSGKLIEASSQASVYPEISSSVVYLYYAPFGAQRPDITAQSFQGKKLNPDLFVSKLYAHLDLANFGVTGWNDGGAVNHKGDVATFDFDVKVFVIGEWDVKDIQEPPDYLPFVPFTENLTLSDYLGDPRIQALIMLIVLVGIFVVILIFAPWVLWFIASLFGGGRRR